MHICTLILWPMSLESSLMANPIRLPMIDCSATNVISHYIMTSTSNNIAVIAVGVGVVVVTRKAAVKRPSNKVD